MGIANQSPFSKMMGNLFPTTPPFSGMLAEQCDILVKTYEHLASYMVKPGQDLVDAIDQLEEQSDNVKFRNLDTLHQAYLTNMDRDDVYRSIMQLHAPIHAARGIMDEMVSLRSTPDSFCQEMAISLRDAARAIGLGFSRIQDEAAKADGDALSAIQCKNSVENVYRRALAALYAVDQIMQNLQNQTVGAEQEALNRVVEMLKNREVYRQLRNAGNQMAQVGELLHAIVVKKG